MEVRLLGGIHFNPVESEHISNVIINKKIDSIFREGVDDTIFDKQLSYQLKYFILDPAFFVWSFVWFRLLMVIFGKDMKSLTQIAHKYGLEPYKNIDASVEELTVYLFPIRLLLYPLIFFILYSILSVPYSLWFSVIASFSITFLIHINCGFILKRTFPPPYKYSLLLMALFLLFAICFIWPVDKTLSILEAVFLGSILHFGAIVLVTFDFRNQKMVSETVRIMRQKNLSNSIFYAGMAHPPSIKKIFLKLDLDVEEI